jgi:hypothetical protein
VLDALPQGITGIDTYMGGTSEITAGFLLSGDQPALIETGPSKVAEAVAAGVAGAGLDPADLAWIVVTHIHLDHAGGVGDLVRTFPNATVVVHPAGARHLVDPERLLASSARVYGPLMETVYGGLTPVEAARIKAAEDGEVLEPVSRPQLGWDCRRCSPVDCRNGRIPTTGRRPSVYERPLSHCAISDSCGMRPRAPAPSMTSTRRAHAGTLVSPSIAALPESAALHDLEVVSRCDLSDLLLGGSSAGKRGG